FLDDKLEKTEKIIELKTRVIGLLKEQKEAMINKAVTKGLDDSVEMKDSGVEWLRKTPVDWSKNRINRVFKSIGSGTTPSSGNQDDIMSRKWTQRIGRNLIFPYRALLAGLSVRRRDISLLLTERIISFTQLYRWSAYNTPFHKQLATCTD